MTFELLAGQTPFFNESQEVTKANIVKCVYNFPPSFDEVSKDFIKKCLVKDQDKRANIEDLAKHQFIKIWEK